MSDDPMTTETHIPGKPDPYMLASALALRPGGVV